MELHTGFDTLPIEFRSRIYRFMFVGHPIAKEAIEILKDKKPVVYGANKENYQGMVELVKDLKLALGVKAANLEEYTLTINSPIIDWQHNGMVLELTFMDGNTYEFFGVNKALFTKFYQSGTLTRFAKRNIFNNCIYRKIKKSDVEA